MQSDNAPAAVIARVRAGITTTCMEDNEKKNKEKRFHDYKRKKIKRYVFVAEAERSKSPTSAVFGEAIRGIRVESFDVGWLEKTKLMLAGFESLRDDRCEVTLPTEPFDTLPSDAFFGDNPGIAWLQKQNFRASMSAIAAFVCSREAKPRGPAI